MRVSPDVNALAAELARLQRSGRLPAETARAFEDALKGAAAPAPARDNARAAFFAPATAAAATAPATVQPLAQAPAQGLPPRPGSILDIKV
jgi:hypothetical protein